MCDPSSLHYNVRHTELLELILFFYFVAYFAHKIKIHNFYELVIQLHIAHHIQVHPFNPLTRNNIHSVLLIFSNYMLVHVILHTNDNKTKQNKLHSQHTSQIEIIWRDTNLPTQYNRQKIYLSELSISIRGRKVIHQSIGIGSRTHIKVCNRVNLIT